MFPEEAICFLYEWSPLEGIQVVGKLNPVSKSVSLWKMTGKLFLYIHSPQSKLTELKVFSPFYKSSHLNGEEYEPQSVNPLKQNLFLKAFSRSFFFSFSVAQIWGSDWSNLEICYASWKPHILWVHVRITLAKQFYQVTEVCFHICKKYYHLLIFISYYIQNCVSYNDQCYKEVCVSICHEGEIWKIILYITLPYRGIQKFLGV